MRGLGVVAGLVCAGALAQTPDTLLKVDMRLHYRSANGQTPTFRFYDGFGESAKISLIATLEPGYLARVSERFQKIPGNTDQELLEEYFIEDPGLWRVGKQWIPFGQGRIVRETALAARGDTTLIAEGVPMTIAFFDNGRGRTQGASGRIGGRLGLSFVAGKNVCSQATNLANTRDIELASNQAQGYKLVLGADFSRRFGLWSVAGEFAAFRQGETQNEPDIDVSDVQISFEPKKNTFVRFGWGQEWNNSVPVFRVQGSFPFANNVWVEPYVRYQSVGVRDAGFSVRVRL